MITVASDSPVNLTRGTVPSTRPKILHWFDCPLMVRFKGHMLTRNPIGDMTALRKVQDLWCTHQETKATFEELADCDVEEFVAHHFPSFASRNVGRKRASIRRFQEFMKGEGVLR